MGRTETYQNVIPATHGVLIDRPRVKHHLRVNAGGLAGGGAVEVPYGAVEGGRKGKREGGRGELVGMETQGGKAR